MASAEEQQRTDQRRYLRRARPGRPFCFYPPWIPKVRKWIKLPLKLSASPSDAAPRHGRWRGKTWCLSQMRVQAGINKEQPGRSGKHGGAKVRRMAMGDK